MQVSLPHVLHELEKQIDSSQRLITKIRDLGLPQIQLEIIVELAFLRIFIAWENFLEGSFIRYLMGAKSPSGYKPKAFVNPYNMEHALNFISQGKDYVKWNSASDVIDRSDVFFKNGEPFKNTLEASTTDLNEMNTIRNRIAHKSKSSQEKFNSLIRFKFGHGIRGMTPGRFLLEKVSSSS